MRKSGWVAVLAVAVAVVLAVVAFQWLGGDGPAASLSSNRRETAEALGEASDPAIAAGAAAAAASADRVEEPVATPARHGRFGVRGVVVHARDRAPAAGATVRVFASQPPLSRMPFREQVRRIGADRKPAAEHDVSRFGGGGGGGGDPSDGGGGDPEHGEPDDEKPAKPAEPPPQEERQRGLPLAVATADADGRFEVLGLEPAGFHVDAQLPLSACANASHVVLDAKTETVREGLELELVPGARVTGIVLDPAGSPVANAEVALAVPFDPFAVFAAEGMELRAPATARTGSDGRFSILGVPASIDLRARATARGFATSRPLTVATRAGSVHEVELRLEAGGTIVARVVDEQGQPLARVSCECTPTQLDLREIGVERNGFVPTHATTDAEGRARFEGLAPGRFRLAADVKERLAASQTVELAAAGTTVEAELRVERGLELSGVVRAKDGTPVEAATIRIRPEPGFASFEAMTNRRFRSGKSDADGAFHVTGLPTGTLVIEAEAKGYQQASQKAEAGGEPVEITLASRGVLEGIVVSRKTTKPVNRFDLKLSRKREMTSFMAFDERSAESLFDLTLPFDSPNGKFRIVGVNPGTLQLTALAEGHGAQSSEWIELAEGETRKGVLLYLDPEAVIEGLVIDAATGAAIAGADVRRDTGGGNVIETMMSQIFAGSDTTTDAEGRFRIDQLSAGEHRLVASRAGYVDASAPPIALATGETHGGLRIELEKGGEIYGRVSSADGTPVPAASVFCQEMTRFKMRSVKTDERGDYRVDGLAAGNYTVTRMPESFDLSSENFVADMTSNLQTHSLRLKAGESVRVDFGGVIQGAAALEGTVTQAGAPVAGAIVTVFVQQQGETAQSGGMKSTSTSRDGSYEITGLQAGPAFVQVNQADMGAEGGQSAAVATVTLRDGATARLDLVVPAGSITGRVIDGATREPLAGVAVYAAAEGASGESMVELAMRRAASVRTGADGTFRLKNLRGGAHRVVAGSADLLSSSSGRHAVVRRDGIMVPDSGQADAGTIVLPAAARIEGTVTDATGRPLSGASVFLREPGNGAYLEEWTGTSSNDSGHFEYGGVPSGRWDLVCRAPGHATAVVRGVTTRENEAASVSVRLIGGTEVFADLGEVDFDKLLQLRLEVDGPEGRIPLTLFGLGDLTDLISQPWRTDVVRLGRFGPGEYHVRGRLGDKQFEKKFVLAGEPELHVPVSLP